MSLRLHNKYGVNPTMNTCFYCGQPKDVILVGSNVSKFKKEGLASEDGEMKMQIGVTDMEPCSKCADHMKMGIILVSVKDEDVNSSNPYRTGGWVVIKENALKNILTKEIFDDINKKRFAFVPDTAWNQLGLPKGK